MYATHIGLFQFDHSTIYTIAACDEDCHFDLHGSESLGWYSLQYEDCNLTFAEVWAGTVCHMKTVILAFTEVQAGTVCHMKTVILHKHLGWCSLSYEDCHFDLCGSLAWYRLHKHQYLVIIHNERNIYLKAQKGPQRTHTYLALHLMEKAIIHTYLPLHLMEKAIFHTCLALHIVEKAIVYTYPTLHSVKKAVVHTFLALHSIQMAIF